FYLTRFFGGATRIREHQSLDKLAAHSDRREGLTGDVVDVASDPFALGDRGEMRDAAVLGAKGDRSMITRNVVEDGGSNDPDHDDWDGYEDAKRPGDRTDEEAGQSEGDDYR